MKVQYLVAMTASALFLWGCGTQGGEKTASAYPPVVMEEGWEVVDLPGAGFTFAVPPGWEFEMMKDKQTLGNGGLFTPSVEVSTGKVLVQGTNMSEQALAQGGSGSLLVIKQKSSNNKSHMELAEADKQVLKEKILTSQTVWKVEELELPVGKCARMEGEGLLSEDLFYIVKVGKYTYRFQFSNMPGRPGAKPIPTKRIMDTFRPK